MEVKIRFDEDELKDNRPPLYPKGWYMVMVTNDPEIGKVNYKFLLWKTEIIRAIVEDNPTEEFDGLPLEFRTIIEKGDDPKKSKRWLFHQAMRALGIKKVTDEKGAAYPLILNKEQTKILNFKGEKFWVRVDVKSEEYKGNMHDKNEVKHINVQPQYWTEKPETKTDETPETAEGEKIPF